MKIPHPCLDLSQRGRAVRFLVGLGLAVLGLPLAAAGFAWKPVAPDELAATKPSIEPDAPGEILFRDMEIDEREYPTLCRTTEYVRLKIFRPEQIERLTRFSFRERASTREFEFQARLVLPDGSIREFGEDAMRERTLARRGGGRTFLDRLIDGDGGTKEKFLAISGIEAGAILEYRLVRDFSGSILAHGLQSTELPIRQARLFYRPARSADYQMGFFVLNTTIGAAKVSENPKDRSITITATNLPTLASEPFQGPVRDRALLLWLTYNPKRVTVGTRGRSPNLKVEAKKDGPWSPIAGHLHVLAVGMTEETARVKKTAKEIAAAAGSPRATAERIHAFVRERAVAFANRPKPGPGLRTAVEPAPYLDEVIDWQANAERYEINAQDFFWLALGLSRAAGLECYAAVLPDRTGMRFDRALVSRNQLPALALATKLDGVWHFSMPQLTEPCAFGCLPFPFEGQVALLGKPGPEEFVGVPYRAADESVSGTTGEFTVEADGALEGRLVRQFTGHLATMIRGKLKDEARKSRSDRLKEFLVSDTGLAEITVEEIQNLDDVEKPVIAKFRARHPGFAVTAGGRLICPTFPTQLNATTPFPTETRHGAIYFPFAWKETEQFTIAFPAGYQPESIPAQRPLRHGGVLAYASLAQFDAAKRVLHVRREMKVDDWLFERDQYPQIKRWFDLVLAADRREAVLVQKPAD